jgi:hypothetical protein
MAPRSVGDDASVSSFSVRSNLKKPETQAKRHVVRRRHSITFSGENTVIEIDKAEAELRDDIWYNKGEYDTIKARNKQIVRMKKTGSFEEDEENTFRGLEHKLKQGFNQRRSNKFNALNAVLAEQDLQYARGLHNAESVAEKYKEEGITAKETAYYLALQDADESYARGKSPKIVVDIDDDGNSVLSELASIVSEDTEGRNLAVKSILHGVSDGYDDGHSVVSDLASINSDDSCQKKTRIRNLFHGISHLKNVKSHRRASM